MSMPKYMIHFPFFFFALTALTGVWMRFYLMSESVSFIPYTHLLHGHSHIAILGWTFLAVFIIFLKMNWEEIKSQRQAITIVITTLLITTIMFIAFLYEGYALYSIILSTIHIGIEYWVIIFIFISLKTISKIPKEGRLFIHGALLTLFISTIGPFSLGAIAAQGLRDSPFFDMAVYFYLHFQYNGWLYLFLIGLFIFLLAKKEIFLQKGLLRASFWVYIISLFPGFFLSILWFDLGLVGIVSACIGAVGQLIGIILFCIALYQARDNFLKQFSNHMNMSFLFIILLLLSKSVMELALLYLPFAQIVYDTRTVVIGYLHLTLLGFISVFILNLYQSSQMLDETNYTVKNGIAIFLFGFIVNEVVLFLSGLFTWMNLTQFAFQNELLLFASIIILCGILIIWSSLFKAKELKQNKFDLRSKEAIK